MARGSSQVYDEDAGSVPRRRLPAAERRAVILDAALRTFAVRGYDGASMDEIAAAAGVSKAVVYDHIASKRELHTVLLDAIRDDLVRSVEAAMRATGGGDEQRAHAAAEAFFRYVEQHPEASRLLIHELQGAAISPHGRELEERLTRRIATRLGDGGALEGHPHRDRGLQILAHLVRSAVQGLASWWFHHPETPRADLVEHTVAVLWPAIERART